MLRLMNENDYDALYALWTSTEGMGLRSLDDSYDGIKKFIDRNPRTNFVYEIDKEIVAGVLCGHDGRRAYIYHALVSPACRGLGIGTQMIQACEDAMSNEGINKICLVVYENNQGGNDFWHHLGYDNRVDLNYRNKSINDKNL